MCKILPNFLIAGAAKSGTSSLHNYLGQHPDIFMSPVKEPRFITSQVNTFPLNGPGDHRVESWYVKRYEDYVKLFDKAGGYTAVGESSADTLYFYQKSIPVIKEYLGDPKIIIMLRDPVKRAFSAYQHLVRDMRETGSFEEGLLKEPDRIKDNWELIYHYTAVSKYYEPVKAFLDNFTSVKVILNEDQAKRPIKTTREVFRFLNVDPNFDICTDIKYNVSGKPKLQWLHNFIFEENPTKDLVKPLVRKFLSQEARIKISHRIQQKNLRQMILNEETKERLQRIFEQDISKLESLIKRDLSSWKR